MKTETKLVTTAKNYKDNSGMVNVPIYRTSTVLFPTLEEYHQAELGNSCYNSEKGMDYSYGISGTPTNIALQEAICAIEEAKHCLLFPSGLSAIATTLMGLLQAGDHALVSDSVYGPTRRFCNKELSRLGIEVTYYDPEAGKDIGKLIRKNTRLIFTESPGSLTFEIQDIPAICKLAKAKEIITVIDNSWATPLYFNPFNFGVDIVIQAGTKYIGGHSDILMGTVTTNNSACFKAIGRAFKNYGIHTSPDDCYLALRGLRTLAVRLKQHEKTALNVARWLQGKRKVKAVLHPALESCPGHEIWKRDFTGSTGLFTFILDKKYSKTAIADMVDNMKLFGIGASWGGFESLILHIDPSSIRTAKKWPHKETCIRVYTGLEAEEDIIRDLEQGLKRLG